MSAGSRLTRRQCNLRGGKHKCTTRCSADWRAPAPWLRADFIISDIHAPSKQAIEYQNNIYGAGECTAFLHTADATRSAPREPRASDERLRFMGGASRKTAFYAKCP
ncbi:hypothetical protein EVAR_87589_1 [Eumeta japonica]|uniref:Uncharacterized protein n=1 Tax=Eumeta variegata TaxID=151549 RepID=A0A4C1WQ30_EUMVA|nr:hypothetical protein EVAR_87589_1 [Eumeta japonica]